MNHKEELDEPILDDDYPVYFDYCYIADGKIILSNVRGTVKDLKRDIKATEIRRYDIFGRNEQKERGKL